MQFPVQPTATPVWSRLAAAAGTVLFINLDNQDTITLGSDAGVIPGDPAAAAILPPGAWITLPAAGDWYAVTADTDGPLLLASPGSTGWGGSPADIATQIVASGLALSIAEAIAGTGISLLGAPQLIYTTQGGTGGTGGLVGLTVPNQALQPGCYAAGQSQAAADASLAAVVGRALPNGHLTVTKKFWNPSDWSLTKNDLANYSTFGTKVYICVQPTFNGTPAQIAADQAALTAFLAALKAPPYNFTAANCAIALWQEPSNQGKNLSSAQYGSMFTPTGSGGLGYGQIVNAAGLPLWVVVNYAGAQRPATNNAVLYAQAALAGGATIAGIAMDYYTNHYFNQPQTLLDPIQAVADGAGLPFGLTEIGCNPSAQPTPPPGHFTIAQCETYLHYLLSFMQARLVAGKPNGDVIYYEGQCSAAGTGDLTSPILLTSDFRVSGGGTPGYIGFQQIFDTLTSGPAGTFTLPGTSTTRLAPINPSPIASFGSTDYMGYEFSLGLAAGAASTNPFCTVILNFYDFDVKGGAQIPVDTVQFTVPMGTNGDPNGPTIIYGHGPARGAYVDIKLNNIDTVAATLTNFQFAGTSRLDGRHLWRWDCTPGSSPVIPGFTSAQAAKGSLQIGREQNVTVNAGASKTFLNGMFPGQAFLRIYQSGAAAAGTVNFFLGCEPVSLFSTSNLVNQLVGSTQKDQEFMIALPRCATHMTITNNDANPVTIDYELIAIET